MCLDSKADDFALPLSASKTGCIINDISVNHSLYSDMCIMYDSPSGLQTRAGDWVGYPIYYCKTQSLGGSFTMHDPNHWAQLNYASTQTQWAWVH